jgi:hypothetical protein
MNKSVLIGVGIVIVLLALPLASSFFTLDEAEKRKVYEQVMPTVLQKLPNSENASFPPFDGQVNGTKGGPISMAGNIHSADSAGNAVTYSYRLQVVDSTSDTVKEAKKDVPLGLKMTLGPGFYSWTIISLQIAGTDFSYELPPNNPIKVWEGAIQFEGGGQTITKGRRRGEEGLVEFTDKYYERR